MIIALMISYHHDYDDDNYQHDDVNDFDVSGDRRGDALTSSSSASRAPGKYQQQQHRGHAAVASSLSKGIALLREVEGDRIGSTEFIRVPTLRKDADNNFGTLNGRDGDDDDDDGEVDDDESIISRNTSRPRSGGGLASVGRLVVEDVYGHARAVKRPPPPASKTKKAMASVRPRDANCECVYMEDDNDFTVDLTDFGL